LLKLLKYEKTENRKWNYYIEKFLTTIKILRHNFLKILKIVWHIFLTVFKICHLILNLFKICNLILNLILYIITSLYYINEKASKKKRSQTYTNENY
jgi:hypothetical protein